MAIRFNHRLTSIILACCAGAMLSGCARMGAMSRVDPVSIAVYPGGRNASDPAPTNAGTSDCQLVRGVNSYSSGAVNLDCFLFPEDRPRSGSTPPDSVQWILPPGDNGQAGQMARTDSAQRPAAPLAYSRAVANPRERNRLTALLLKHSDDICVQEMGRLNSNESAVNSALTILATAATTTANIVTGELAQSILTGAGTLSGASRSHINAHVYRNTFAYAVSRAITIERQRLRVLIEARRNQDTTAFTVDEAIQAANAYHGVCSFYKGLELVLASVEGDQRSRDAEMRRTQIDAIDQEIRRQQDGLAAAADSEKATYRNSIAALNERRRTLVLAGIPDPAPKSEPEPEPEPTEQPVDGGTG